MQEGKPLQKRGFPFLRQAARRKYFLWFPNLFSFRHDAASKQGSRLFRLSQTGAASAAYLPVDIVAQEFMARRAAPVNGRKTDEGGNE